MADKKPCSNKNQHSTKRLRSKDLFVNTRVIVIEHLGEDYYLRLTNNGKLILTKG